ncbi:19699_t:CDS:2 [Racocetra persica]|uniref:19699_t:CDS:1 n=1 Tax=Racocetra persica TaxID=160502 RepID=A0ACA9RUJ8_9GLOM|nr:19699_t:CDS:2 [Racocetra persica]
MLNDLIFIQQTELYDAQFDLREERKIHQNQQKEIQRLNKQIKEIEEVYIESIKCLKRIIEEKDMII